MKPLPKSFYARETVQVARDLLGKRYHRKIGDTIVSGYIIETEAYRSDDEACHAYKGLTKRTAPLFGHVGQTYVYICYGIHYCLNIVARDSTCLAGGVLIRALYQHTSDQKGGMHIIGPGKLAKSLSITTEHIGIPVIDDSSELIITEAPRVPDSLVNITPRIGISKGTDKLWRFSYDPEDVQPRDEPDLDRL